MAIGDIAKLNNGLTINDPILEEMNILCSVYDEYHKPRAKSYADTLNGLRVNRDHLKVARKHFTESTKGFPELYDIIAYLKQRNWIPEENERRLEEQKRLELEAKERKRLFDLETKEKERQNRQYSEGAKETQRLNKLMDRVIQLINDGWAGTLTIRQSEAMEHCFGGCFENPNCFDVIEISAEHAHRIGLSKKRWLGFTDEIIECENVGKIPYERKKTMDNLYRSGNQSLETGSFWKLLEDNRREKGFPEITDIKTESLLDRKLKNPSLMLG